MRQLAQFILRLSCYCWLAGICVSMSLAQPIRDGGIDPRNLGKGAWIYFVGDATNKLGGHVPSVTNLNSLMQFYRSSGIRYCIVKAGDNTNLFNGLSSTPQFNTNLVNAAKSNGVAIFGYNRSYGLNIPGEIALADYVFNQGADGFVFDAEAEWENTTNNITKTRMTNGPALAWQLCSTVRSNWPNKFLAHSPFAIIYVHTSFPYKEFGFWCDAVMPQAYHFSSTGLRESTSATINWMDVNWRTWQNTLASIPQTNAFGQPVAWTNAIKPIIPIQDVYGEVIPGGIIAASPATEVYPDRDVAEFIDYCAATPHAATTGGYQGVNFWRSDTIGTNQWLNIIGGTSGIYSNIVRNVVLDDSRATYTGSWNAQRVFSASTTSPTYWGATGTDTNSFGTNYCWKVAGSGAAFAQFTPPILIPGNYDVFQWHVLRTNASGAVPFIICTPNGTNTVLVNLKTNDGNWSFVGRFNFAAGTNNFIRITDGFTDTTNIVIVDGLKLMYVDPEIVLDNTNSAVSFTGIWTTATSATDKFGSDYFFASSSTTVTATATYRPNFLNPGRYDVWLWYPAGANRASNSVWTISSLAGSTNVIVNQQINGGVWRLIAADWPFAEGTNGFVRLSNQAGPSVVMADAVRFVFDGPLTPVSLPAISRPPGGSVNLTVSSTPGYPVAVERSTNLTAWATITNLLNTNGTVTFNDTSATNLPAGFYRARH